MKTELEQIRDQLGWTQARMAGAMGLSLRAYADAERDPAKTRDIHLLAARNLLMHGVPADAVIPLSLEELSAMFRDAQARAAALSYPIKFTLDPQGGAVIATGTRTFGMRSHSATTGRSVADVLANPKKAIDYMLNFIESRLLSAEDGARPVVPTLAEQLHNQIAAHPGQRPVCLMMGVDLWREVHKERDGLSAPLTAPPPGEAPKELLGLPVTLSPDPTSAMSVVFEAAEA